MRCTMGESMLSPLAIMHIKYDMLIDLSIDCLKASTLGWTATGRQERFGQKKTKNS